MELGREAQRTVALHFIEEDLRRLCNQVELEIALTDTPEAAEAIGKKAEEWIRDLIRVGGHCLDRANELNRPGIDARAADVQRTA